MIKSLLKLIIILTASAGFVGCSEDTPKPEKPTKADHFWSSLWDSETAQELPKITVTNINGTPLAGAQVLIGYALNNPFENNLLKTDDKGQILIPVEWNQSLPVTVNAAGHIRVSYFDILPSDMTIQLRQIVPQNYEIRGLTSGFNIQNNDGKADCSLILPALTKMDILNFNLNSIISPVKDDLDVPLSTVKLPSNISIPKQKERYGLFSVTLDKPVFRAFVNKSGYYRVYAAKVSFPFKPVVDGFRSDTPLHEMINQFSITGGGIRDVDIQGPTQVDIPVNEITYKEKRPVIAPHLNNDETIIALSVQNQSGMMIPLDIKKINSDQNIPLNVFSSAKNEESLLVSILKRSSEMDAYKDNMDRISASINNFTQQQKPDFLPLINNPSLDSNGDILLPPVYAKNNINPLVTYAILSDIEEKRNGNKVYKIPHAKWEIFVPHWRQGSLKIPQWPNEKRGTRKRWGVAFIGSQKTMTAQLGPQSIESATHVTFSSVDF